MMKTKTLLLMIKNTLRYKCSTVKNWITAYFCCALSIAFLLLNGEAVAAFCRQYQSGIEIGMACLLFVMLVTKRYPLVLMNPATLHFLPDRRIVLGILILKFSAYVLVMAAVGVGWGVFIEDYWSGVHLFSILVLWMMLTWQRYHHSVLEWLLLLEMATAAALFAFQQPMLGIAFNGVVMVVQLRRMIALDWDRYMKDMISLDALQSAAARMDWSRMMAVANDIAVKDHYVFHYPKQIKIHPLLKKSLLDALRLPKGSWTVLAIELSVALVALLTPIFGSFGPMAFIVVWNFAVSTLTTQNLESMVKMKRKHDAGLIIPYDKRTLANCYALWPIVEIVLLQIGLALLTPIIIWPALLAAIAYGIVVYAWHHLHIKRPHWQRAVNLWASMLFYAISGGMLLFV
ncbi:MAG: hypothetical protein UDG94_04200 [Peptococcaceae bacterium]|nr:hypothetical protein [Peptococcaceae bacterium]